MISRCRYCDDDASLLQENEREITSGPSCTLLIDYIARGGKGCVWVESNESARESTMGAGVHVCAHATERNFNVYQHTCTFKLSLMSVALQLFRFLIPNELNRHLGRISRSVCAAAIQ